MTSAYQEDGGAPAGLSIRSASSWSEIRDGSGLLDLVNRIQSGEPYNYGSGEIPSAEIWVPPLVDRADLTSVAYDPADQVVGYCVSMGLTGYPDALAIADELGVEPSTTTYLAELGVSPTVRRCGIAGLLLGRALRDPPAGTTAWVVRTLEINAAAIALYQRYDFELEPAAAQVRHGRPRVHLVRHDAEVRDPQPARHAFLADSTVIPTRRRHPDAPPSHDCTCGGRQLVRARRVRRRG